MHFPAQHHRGITPEEFTYSTVLDVVWHSRSYFLRCHGLTTGAVSDTPGPSNLGSQGYRPNTDT